MSEEELRQYCKDASNEIIKLEEENTQLKSVLKEIREYINKQLAFCDNEGNLSYEICSLTISKYKKILEIIDKGIGE